MNITLPIPDDLAGKLALADSSDLARRALEAFVVEEYRAGHLTLPELRRVLGFDTRYALDGFLKARGVYLDYRIEDLDQERRELLQLGF